VFTQIPSYEPGQEILNKYADVLVRFALNSGKGIKPGDLVRIAIPEAAKPLLFALQRSILQAGGNLYVEYQPGGGFNRQFFENASQEQLGFVPQDLVRGLVKSLQHTIRIIADDDLHELEGIDPQKIMTKQKTMKLSRSLQNEKEQKGEFTWTIGLYGTEALAKEAGMTLKEYWEQIIKACYLEDEDPIATWKETFAGLEQIRTKLNSMPIARLHLEAEDTDLWIIVGEQRQWLAGSGRNIPSFEMFLSPDWRGTEGKISFNQPLYYNGSMIENVRLVFEKGRVVSATATQNEHLLKEMITQPNADKVGEFSLTDQRYSRIERLMCTTLYDENIGRPHGNTHIAVGMSYRDSYDGDLQNVTLEELEALGFNDPNCSVHTDIISTTNRVVTAYLKDGTSQVIYKDGQFTV
jgi:aminopeptidase